MVVGYGAALLPPEFFFGECAVVGYGAAGAEVNSRRRSLRIGGNNKIGPKGPRIHPGPFGAETILEMLPGALPPAINRGAYGAAAGPMQSYMRSHAIQLRIDAARTTGIKICATLELSTRHCSPRTSTLDLSLLAGGQVRNSLLVEM